MKTTNDKETSLEDIAAAKTPEKKQISKVAVKVNEQPNVFDYIDYREFLKDFYEYKKKKNPSYSESAFIQSAGFGKNSRGYLGLILKEKRNLTTKTILGFAKSLKLNTKQTMYFENMVYFNQAKDEEEKLFFFERMEVSSSGERSKTFEVLESQYRYISNWYLVAIREIVNLKDFKEDTNYIYKKLRRKVPKDKIEEAIKDLLNLGLIARNQKGILVQANPLVTFSDNKHNFKNTTKLHTQFIDIAKDMLETEDYQDRAAQLVTLSCPKEKFENIRTDLQEYAQDLLKKYAGDQKQESDAILQLGIQLFKLTE